MPHFNKYAYLSHYLVVVTEVAAFDVNTTRARLIALLLSLLPNVEVDAMGGVVFLPLRKTAHCLVTLWQVSNL